MSFIDCAMTCAGNYELVSEFNRLTGHHMGERRTEIIKQIDAACGYDPDKDAIPDFISFVYSCIWVPCCNFSE